MIKIRAEMNEVEINKQTKKKDNTRINEPECWLFERMGREFAVGETEGRGWGSKGIQSQCVRIGFPTMNVFTMYHCSMLIKN